MHWVGGNAGIISSHCLSFTLLTLEGRPQEGGVWALPPPPLATQIGFPDNAGSHSPDTLIEDEELLVGQPFALEDSDHAVMDAVGRRESSHPEEPCLALPSRPASSHISSPLLNSRCAHTLLQPQIWALDTNSGSQEPARPCRPTWADLLFLPACS